MKTEVLKIGEKMIVKTHNPEPSDSLHRRWEQKLGLTLNYCGLDRDGGVIWWNGADNVPVAGWQRFSRATIRRQGGAELTVPRRDNIGKRRVPEIVRELQRRYGKLRYARRPWPKHLYEGLIRPKANGQTVADFDAPRLL
jgi:hypothetical protein